ncbi:hypothetical protein GCM10023336_01540 [Streptomyces similanensis]|uniref:Transposase n=1 Tax=Streptomyces similanensis TaxID=1274988 RepID=A0ABP9JQB5_9ACTN
MGRARRQAQGPRPRATATPCGPPTPARTASGTCSLAYDLGKDQLYEHIKKTKNRNTFLEFCRYLRSLHSTDVRIAIVCANYSPHLITKRCRRVANWTEANNVEVAYTPRPTASG